MSRFTITNSPLAGLKVIERRRLTDARGFLARVFCSEEFAVLGWKVPIAQINQTSTYHRGAVRGMHFQYPPHAEMKLVSCIQGEVWDVAIDIRRHSPTFLHWYGVSLSADNCLALMIPEGFAHGFQAMTEGVELLYCHSMAYSAEFEGALNPLDPDLALHWPLPVTEISLRDSSHPPIKNGFKGVDL